MTLEEMQELADAEKRVSELRAKHAAQGLPTLPPRREEYRPAGATEARALNPTPAAPPQKTDAERVAELEQRVKALESSTADMKQKLWAEWQIVQDQIRAEVHRLGPEAATGFGTCAYCGQKISRIGTSDTWVHDNMDHSHPQFPCDPLKNRWEATDGKDEAPLFRCIVCDGAISRPSPNHPWRHLQLSNDHLAAPKTENGANGEHG